MRGVGDVVAYVAVNIWMSGEEGGKGREERGRYGEVMGKLSRVNKERARRLGVREVPIVMKVSSEIGYEDLGYFIGVVEDKGLGGINIGLPGRGDREGEYRSGVSTYAKVLERARYVGLERKGGGWVLMAGGGVHTVGQVGGLLDVGVDLVQVYSALIYGGLFVGRKLNGKGGGG